MAIEVPPLRVAATLLGLRQRGPACLVIRATNVRILR